MGDTGRFELHAIRGWFGVCACGHGIDAHARIKPSGNPNFQYVACGAVNCPCLLYRASDGSGWPDKTARVTYAEAKATA